MSPSNQKLSLGAKSPVTWLLGRVLACDQAIQSALAAGREKEGELATTSLEFEFHLYFPVAPYQLSCQIVANQREVEQARM